MSVSPPVACFAKSSRDASPCPLFVGGDHAWTSEVGNGVLVL
ncbi:hypothetical protein [Xylella fastidiosa]